MADATTRSSRWRALAGAVGVQVHAARVPFLAISIVVIAILGGVGALREIMPEARIPWRFDLDAERSFPAAATAALLLGTAALALALSGVAVVGRPAGILAAVLAFMAFDELLVIHESIERSTAIDWQLLYLPIMAIAAVSLASVVLRLRRSGWPTVALILGAAAWAASQVLEATQWGLVTSMTSWVYDAMMISEEVGEMVGTLLLLVGVAVALDTFAHRAGRTDERASAIRRS